MDRPSTQTVLMLALAAAGCGKKPLTDEASMGSASAGSALASGDAAPKGSAVSVVAPLAPDALDAALKAKGIAPAAVKQRAQAAHSAWAVVADKTNAANALDVIRVRADGVADVHLAPPSAAEPSSFGDTISLETRDLNGDGIEEAVLVVDWRRTTKITGGCKGCWVSTDEEAKQLYVLSGAGTAVAPAFTHVISYETHSEGFPEENATPYASPEQVAYEWKLVDGKPPVVKLTRTKHEVAKEDRLKGVLDPSTDALFAAGPGKDVPLVLE